MLVSRQEELDKLPENALDDWDNIRVLSDTALDELEDGAADRPSDLHAKILAVEHGWDVTWHVGSANITTAAHTGRNVELMATLNRPQRTQAWQYRIRHRTFSRIWIR